MLRMERSGLAHLRGTHTFERFAALEQWQIDAKEKAMRYASEGAADGWWLFMGGQPGTGKTHLCTAACFALMDAGRSVRYAAWREEAAYLKANRLDEEAFNRRMGALQGAQVLYLDDFYKTAQGGRPTDADVGLAFDVVNGRYARKKRTIISSELTTGQIAAIDEAVGSRIAEASEPYCANIARGQGRNWRLAQTRVKGDAGRNDGR